jgi:hypothetical protein
MVSSASTIKYWIEPKHRRMKIKYEKPMEEELHLHGLYRRNYKSLSPHSRTYFLPVLPNKKSEGDDEMEERQDKRGSGH